jgi:acyl-CoA thioester hydrolase
MSGPALTPADFPFWSEEKLRIADTDHNGHINNGAIGQYCEAGRAELMQAATGGRDGRDFAIAVARVAIDYLREVHYPGRVRIGSRVSRIGTSSVTVEQGLFLDGVLFARAENVLVALDRQTRRPTPIPALVRKALAEMGKI